MLKSDSCWKAFICNPFISSISIRNTYGLTFGYKLEKHIDIVFSNVFFFLENNVSSKLSSLSPK